MGGEARKTDAEELNVAQDVRRKKTTKAKTHWREMRLSRHKEYEHSKSPSKKTCSTLETAFMEWLEKDGGTVVRSRRCANNSDGRDIVIGKASGRIDYGLLDTMADSDDDISPALGMQYEETDDPELDFDLFASPTNRLNSAEFTTWLKSVSNLAPDDARLLNSAFCEVLE